MQIPMNTRPSQEGSGKIKAAAVNDGMVIITDDEDLADKFKELKFK